ncbi:DNA primase large subunit [Ascobolus immersus RN42]|uniref:DNA primase large subunit n=1 Tax=Ascobolus immersus RN42 TaxID=1160509 RepID=A0A3N4IAE5_ASCIM|nr:DNA primase large subunit [Ascobolus immersus RN42]
MFRQDTPTAPKKYRALDTRKANVRQSAAQWASSDYPHRLNFYNIPPTAEVTLDEFEQWAIDRLKVLGEIETLLFRNKNGQELATEMKPVLDKYLPLSHNPTLGAGTKEGREAWERCRRERKKDHYSHFIVRLAFARSEELRRRFLRCEAALFSVRFMNEDSDAKREFVRELGLAMEPVGDAEAKQYAEELGGMFGARNNSEWYKVEWERVPDLVEKRMVFVRRGMAYVPSSLQGSLVQAEFTQRLEKDLELTARALPRLDEDSRLLPILNHLSLGFSASDTLNNNNTLTSLNGETITAAQIDGLVQHFPLCMRHLHLTLRQTGHLKHFGRLQYTLFLKGIGLSVEEALIFWRQAFKGVTDDKFNKEYRYNIRHSYGLEGNRRNYKPHSCQQILTDHPPGPGESHGCPYRHFSMDNLIAAVQSMGVNEKGVLDGVKKDVEAKKFHLACNRVFEFTRRKELKEVAGHRDGSLGETITHPNEYFEKSWKLVHGEALGGSEVKKEDRMEE